MVIEYIDPPKALVEAARDYKYLLDRGFNREYALRFVCDHYTLHKNDRLIIYRSIHSTEHLKNVFEKIISKHPLEESLHIDFYNVILTIVAMLRSQILYRGNDRFLRDMSGVHGRVKDDEGMYVAIDIFKSIINYLEPPRIFVYLEPQVSKSGLYASYLRKIFSDIGEVTLTRGVDNALCIASGIVATSDSVIHEKAIHIIDIPHISAEKSDNIVRVIDFTEAV